MTTLEIELAVSGFFGVRQHLMVPNVSWGLGLHECDMLIVTKSGFANEVEIKVSRYDLKRDLNKHHGHRSRLIRRLFFAIPKDLSEFTNLIPEHAGIILIVKNQYDENVCNLVRPAQVNKGAKPLTTEQIIHLGRLASMRIWSLKGTLVNRKNNHDQCVVTYEERAI